MSGINNRVSFTAIQAFEDDDYIKRYKKNMCYRIEFDVPMIRNNTSI